VSEADWAQAMAQRQAVLDRRPGAFASATLANLDELLALMRDTGRPLPVIGEGYWPTFILEWDASGFETFQIEVFEDRFEVYGLATNPIDITYVHRAPGQAFPDNLITALPPPGG